MQNSQEINWYEIGKIIIPSLVALIVPFITYWLLSRKMGDYQKDISKELESYKIELNKELENHKVQLQSDFQTKLYEFQTRFSLLHQKRIEAICLMYSLIAETSILLVTESGPSIKGRTEFRKKQPKNAIEKYNETMLFFQKNRIYFDEELSLLINKTICSMEECVVFIFNNERGTSPATEEQFDEMLENRESAFNIAKELIGKVLSELQDKCFQMISAEKIDNQLVKKQ